MTTTYREISLDRIRPNHRNPRLDVGDVTELADSIREQGLLEPLIVAPLDERAGEEYVLIAGHRRTAAAKVAGLEQVPCIVRADLDTDAKQLEAMLVENLQRTDLSPVEEASAYEQLKIYGYDAKRIAKATGRTKATVDKRLALMKLDQDKRAKVHAHELSLADADIFIEFADDAKATAMLEQYLGSSNFKWAVQRLRDNRAAAKKVRKEAEQLLKAGVKVLPKAPEGWPWSAKGTVSLRTLGCTPEEHADCPDHIAVVYVDAGGMSRVDFGCANPDQHRAAFDDEEDASPDRPAVAGGAISDAGLRREQAERARWEAERAEQEQRRADIETACRVRREFVADFLGTRKPSAEQVVTVLRWALADVIDEFGDPLAVADWAGITSDDQDIDEQEFVDELGRRVEAADTPAKLAMLFLAAGAAMREPVRHSYGAEWLQLLAALGHELSDAERSLLPTPAADVDAAEAAAS